MGFNSAFKGLIVSAANTLSLLACGLKKKEIHCRSTRRKSILNVMLLPEDICNVWAAQV
jgi:hypothetical protein